MSDRLKDVLSPLAPKDVRRIADEMGVDETTVYNWRAGRRGSRISREHLADLARLLGMTVDELLSGAPDDESVTSDTHRALPLSGIELGEGELLIAAREAVELTTGMLLYVVEVLSLKEAERTGCARLAKARIVGSVPDPKGGGGARVVGRRPGKPRGIRRQPDIGDVPLHEEDSEDELCLDRH